VCQHAFVVPPRVEAYDPIHVRKLGEDPVDHPKCPWQVFVVAVQPCHDFTSGTTEAFVQGIAVAFVAFAAPVVQVRLILADDVGGSVGASAVDHDVFQIGVVLAQNRLDCLFDKACLVE
jgi:hypothetical protein